MHLLALRISSFLDIKPDAVLKHWASAKIARAKSTAGGDAQGQQQNANVDDLICKQVVEKFEKLGGGEVSYAEIAKRAWEVGRTNLAIQVCSSVSRVDAVLTLFRIQLLDHEPKAADQVPLLLEMKDDKRALQKAVDSGDTDLGKAGLRTTWRSHNSALFQCTRFCFICTIVYPSGPFSDSLKKAARGLRLLRSCSKCMQERRIGRCYATFIIRTIVE
jgi:hypothetical protein